MVRYFKSLRLQFLVIAISLAVITTVLGLSAYLVDRSTFGGSFETVAGSDLGFSVFSDKYTSNNTTTLIPGDTLELDASAKVSGNIPLYVFVDINCPDEYCTIEGMNTQFWHQLGNSDVYYYGYEGELSPLGQDYGKNPVLIFNGIKLSETAKVEETFNFSVTGYAIQQKTMDKWKTDPSRVYSELIKNLPSADTSGEGET